MKKQEMKDLKMCELKKYAEQKTLDYLRRHYATEENHFAPDNEFITLNQFEYDTCMDLFIAGYRYANGLNDFESEFTFTNPS